jgi:hypothetical protein
VSPRSKRTPVRSPRRKAGRAAKRGPKKLKFMLTVDAQDMLVEYTPNYFDGEYAQGHFEFSSPHKPNRGIPVSKTGYRSHFVPMAQIKSAGGPEACARDLVDSMLFESSKAFNDLRRKGQLSLF